MSVSCPCCGAEMHTPGLSALRYIRVTTLQRQVLDVLINAFPRTLSTRQIADRVYADDPNGGPDKAEGCIEVSLYRIRKVIKHVGWTAGTSGPHGGIGLRQIEAREAA